MPFPMQRDAASVLRGLGNDSTAENVAHLQTAPLVWPVVLIGTQQTLPQPSLRTWYVEAAVPAPAPALQHAAVELAAGAAEVIVWAVRTSVDARWGISPKSYTNDPNQITGATNVPSGRGSRPYTTTQVPGTDPNAARFVLQQGIVDNGGLAFGYPTVDLLRDLAERAGGLRVPPGHRLTIAADVANVAMDVELAASDTAPVIAL
jgi:hypothetical protein